MVDKENEGIPADEQETIKAEPKPKPKTETKPKTKAKAKTKAAPKTKTAAAEKPAEAPPAAAPPPPVAPPVAEKTPSPGNGSQRLLLGGTVVVIGLVVIVVLATALFGGGGGKNIIIGFPDNDRNYDIYLLQPGDDEDDGVRIAKDVQLGGTSFYIIDDGQILGVMNGFGFIPGTSQVLLSYEDDGETIIQQMRVNDDEPLDLFDTEDWVQVGVYPDQKLMMLFEYRDDGSRCYTAKFGEEADRVGKGTQCGPSMDGRYIIVVDEDDNETTFTRYDVKRDDELEFLTVEDVEDYAFTDDLTKVAYVINSSDDEQELHIFDIKSEEDEDLEEDFAIPTFGFTKKGDLYYIVEDDDGNLEAFVNGIDDPIGEGEIMSVRPDPEGDYMIIVSGDDGDDLTLYVYSIRKEEAEEIYDGEYLRVAILQDPAQLIISEEADGDLTILSADIDGGNLVEIYDEKDIGSFDGWTVPGQEYFYLDVNTKDGSTLLACKVGGDECIPLIEEMNSITLHNLSSDGRNLVFSAVEDSGDDPILYGVRLGSDPDVVELDDDIEGIKNAVFADNDRDVLYTAINGDDPDEVSINLVPVSGDDKPEELHDEAELFVVQWGDLYPFDVLSFSWNVYGSGN